MLEIKFERFDAVIELFPHGILLTPSSQTAYDGTDNNPVPVSDRGIFFGNTEKNAYMVIEGCQANPLILGSSFTLVLWIRPTPAADRRRRLQLSNNSTLLSSSSGELDLSIATAPSSTTFTTTLNSDSNNTTTLLGSPTENSWTNVSAGSILSSGITTNTISINGLIGSVNSVAGGLLVSDSNSLALGASSSLLGRRLNVGCSIDEFILNYEGFFYSMSGDAKLAFEEDLSTVVSTTECLGDCDSCLADGQCISTCESNQFINLMGECQDCDPTCISCVDDLSCSLCADPDCQSCSTYDTCDTCILKCTLPREPDCEVGVCVCPNGGVWWADIQECMEKCPTSYKLNQDTLICELLAYDIMALSFQQFDATIEIFPYGIILETSISKSFTENPDETPTPVKDRGMYFGASGNDGFLRISGCQDKPLVLPSTFSISMWINPGSKDDNDTRRRLQDSESTLLSVSSCDLKLSIGNSTPTATFSTKLDLE